MVLQVAQEQAVQVEHQVLLVHQEHQEQVV